LPGCSQLPLNRESQLFEHSYRAGLPAFEVSGGKLLACGELIRCAQDCLRRVTTFVPDPLISRGRSETMLGEELLGAQLVVLAYRAQPLPASHAVPRHHRCASLVVVELASLADEGDASVCRLQ